MKPEKQAGLDRLDALLGVAVAGVCLVIYQRTLAPGLLPGDGGEFQTLGYLLGNAHPTGYPIYLLLAKLFTLLPVGDIAYRVNLLSAAAGAATAAVVYLIGRLAAGHRGAALVAALALAAAPTFWSQALIAEVYTSSSLFIGLILLALMEWQRTGSDKALFAAGALGGLGLGIHVSVILMAPAALLFLLAANRTGRDGRPSRLSWRQLLQPALGGAAAGVVVTILAFLLLYSRGQTADYYTSVIGPSHSAWALAAGEVDGAVDQMLFGWSMIQFRPYMFADPGQVMAKQAADYWQHLPTELAMPLLALALLGAAVLLRRQLALGLLITAGLLIHWLVTFNYEIWDLYVFYIPGYLLLALLAAAGLGSLVDGIRRLPGHPLLWDLALAGFMLFSAVWPIFSPNLAAVTNGEVPFRWEQYPVTTYSLNTLHPLVTAGVAELPPDAILFTDWDLLYPLYYAAHVEQGRSDLTFIETFPRDDTGRLADSLIEFVDQNLGQHPIYFSERMADITEAGYSLGGVRIGPLRLFRVLPKA